jgi:hypothetical protein
VVQEEDVMELRGFTAAVLAAVLVPAGAAALAHETPAQEIPAQKIPAQEMKYPAWPGAWRGGCRRAASTTAATAAHD